MLNGKRNILIQIFGCLLFLSLPLLFSPDLNDFKSIGEIFVSHKFQKPFIASVFLLVYFYANYYIFIPKFYVPKKHFVFFLMTIGCFLIVLFVPELMPFGKRFGPMPHLPPPSHKKGFALLVNHNFFQFIGVFAFSLLVKIRERLKQTETEKTNAELSYLKAQINPHFLFNTLNSIYSLAILKSDKTADAVVKLADMMRYVLNDSNANFVSLEKELKYIANYIDLQKMRLTSNVKLTYSSEGNYFDKKIAPLVLIPFIENAFKHGVNSEENSDIDIKIRINDSHLELTVKNNCVTTNNNTLHKSGLGIENTKQRLNLLYPQNYQLDITEKENIFSVHLILNTHD